MLRKHDVYLSEGQMAVRHYRRVQGLDIFMKYLGFFAYLFHLSLCGQRTESLPDKANDEHLVFP